ncbi:SDR family NAD(P)-dependent oxidoreductase [Ferviditalea candida]|uniref:SDR family NAD(P)-dependent oxidoreductase n=1 Tax=Ferviditalea candida TaxID=3108399 RepID=A0ABU5ZG95_9BACL|nr:SDR family NAD(P)-dependent oxidoreductase [Paenibacillaceae bacterium T2]
MTEGCESVVPDLKNKVILVTGAGRGIGRGIAEYCLNQGASVVIAEIDPDRVAAASKALSRYENRILGVTETVSTMEGASRTVQASVERFGRVDVLVNNAALTKDRSIIRMSEQEFDEVIATNLKGAFNCTKSVLPQMLEQGAGRIINMTAVSGFSGNPGQTNYAAAKGGLMAMTLTWSAELSRKNIAVNAVIPAAWTEMSETIPTEGLIQAVGEEMYRRLRSRKPSQVAPLIGFLASDAARGITGQCFSIAGRELAVWGFARPVVQAEAPDEEWTMDSLETFVKEKNNLWQKPVEPFI